MAVKTRWKIARRFVQRAMQENFGMSITRGNNFQQVFFWKTEKNFQDFSKSPERPPCRLWVAQKR